MARLILAGAIAAATFCGCSTSSGTDSVKQAREINQQTGTSARVDPQIAKFMVNAADARLMDKAEGELAASRGTRENMRAYGALMVDEQATLLKRLQVLATRVGVVLPVNIGEAKRDGLSDLQKLSGPDLDAKFIKMITIDHKRDVRKFERASKFENAEVRQFAIENLPMSRSRAILHPALSGAWDWIEYGLAEHPNL